MFEGLFQPTHLIIILVIVLIIFGPGKLPELGSALGRGIKEFRGGIRDATEEEPTTDGRATMIATPEVPAATTTSIEARVSAPAAAQVCPNCGAPQAAGAHFCPNCGTPLEVNSGSSLAS